LGHDCSDHAEEQWRSPDRVLREHSEWWTDRIARRMDARDPARPPWDRALFLRQISDCPGADELADKFGRAVSRAHGNSARFRRALA
jgi:hypothetical protein